MANGSAFERRDLPPRHREVKAVGGSSAGKCFAMRGGMLLVRACALALVVTAAPAVAQSLSLTLNGVGTTADAGTVDAGTATTAVNASNCDSSVTVTWAISAAGTSCNSGLRIWVDTGSCGTDPDDGVEPLIQVSNWNTQLTGTTQLTVSELPGISGSDEGVGCGQIEKDYKVCGALQYNNGLSGCQALQAANAPTLRYDGLPPQAPGAPTLSSLDNSVGVSFVAPGDTAFMVVQFRRAGSTNDFTRLERVSVSRGGQRIEGLANGVEYEVQVLAIDSAGNESAPSPSSIGQPKVTIGFFSEYRRAGGAESGGCGAMQGGAAAGGGVLALYGLWAFSRRRR